MHILGFLGLLTPVVLLFIFAARDVGIKPTLMIFCTVAALYAWVQLSVYLITS